MNWVLFFWIKLVYYDRKLMGVFMEKLADVLKIFIEKHLFPTIISIAGSIISLLYITENNWILLKIGKTLFLILSFCIFFIIVQLFLRVIKVMWAEFNRLKKRIKQQKDDQEDMIENINELVDRLCPEDKALLVSFLKNGNKPLISFESFDFEGLLCNHFIVNVSDYAGELLGVEERGYWITNEVNNKLLNYELNLYGLKQYKIRNEMFDDFMFVYGTKGRLGNFD